MIIFFGQFGQRLKRGERVVGAAGQAQQHVDAQAARVDIVGMRFKMLVERGERLVQLSGANECLSAINRRLHDFS